MSETVSLTPSALEDLATGVLIRAGTREPSARSVARALVRADADGIASHGVARLPAYAAQVRAGKVAGEAEPTATAAGTAGVRVDAADGFAFPAIDLAIDRLAALAPQTGVATAAITNSHHFGVAGHHPERLAEQGLIGIVLGNSPAAMAPWGGHRAIYGTNPMAFAFPRPGTAPIVVDLSLSKQARGKVMLAAKEGRPIPEGWALDADGNPTTDAKAALGGSMLPLGDAKGSALALAVEILSAALTGAHFGAEASSFFDDKGGPPRVGQVLLALAPGPFSGGAYTDRLAALIGAVLEQDGTRLPGDRRLVNRARAQADGIAVPRALHDDLVAMSGA